MVPDVLRGSAPGLGGRVNVRPTQGASNKQEEEKVFRLDGNKDLLFLTRRYLPLPGAHLTPPHSCSRTPQLPSGSLEPTSRSGPGREGT